MSRTLLAALIAALLICPAANARDRGIPGVKAIIRQVFGPYAEQAIRVADCETGGTFWWGASNGQYLGIFQMGASERARYGHGNGPWPQARAAYRYFVASGRDWSPWQCRWAA